MFGLTLTKIIPAFAKQAGPNLVLQSQTLDRGYIDSLDFKVDGKQVDWSFHPEWNDVIKIEQQPLEPGKTIDIETPFFVKIPKVFQD